MTNDAGNFDDLDLGVTLRGFVPEQKLFSRYILKRIAGRGGMGVVWLAHDDKLERDVALKFLPEIVVRDKTAIADLKRETKRCLELTHPNIVRVNDFVEDDARGIAAIAMEYVDGDNLSNLRADREHRCFEADELRRAVLQLCGALDYAHSEAKVVHRDLKPANLMMNSRGDLRVTDFGVARSLVDSVSRVSATAEGHSSGTLVYMSPQQALGKPATVADDIYSVGATLYDLLTGRPPFYTGNIYEQLKEVAPPSISERRLELWGGGGAVPAAWEQTVAACLEKDPAKRPQSAGEVASRLGLAQGYTPQPVAEIPEPEVIRVAEREWVEPTTTSGLPKSYKTALISIAALLLVCGALAGWWFGVEKPKREAEKQAQAAEAQKQADAERQQELDAAKAKADEAEKQRLAAEAEKKNEEDAASLAEQKRKAKEAEAQSQKDYVDGLLCYSGSVNGTMIDITKAIGLFQKAAGQNFPEAEARLAFFCDQGIGLAMDKAKAQEWGKKAIEDGLETKVQTGEASAQEELGTLYLYGLGVTQDYSKAAGFYQKAADQGDRFAQTNLGQLSENGEGVPQSYKKAADFYQKAADQGFSVAQYNLGVFYLNGLGVTQDYSKAAELYQKAADQGLAAAQDMLGNLYFSGKGVPRNYPKAVELFGKAADQGYAPAQVDLGLLYEGGQAEQQNYAKAIELYQKAADQNYAPGQAHLAGMYEKGLGVEQSYAKSVELFQKAADQNYAPAQAALGWLYQTGSGVSLDGSKAIEWYQKAADQGDIGAQLNLGNIYYYGWGAVINYAKAVELFKKAADQGNIEALDKLANCYANGMGVPQDRTHAMQLYQKAAALGDPDAKKILYNMSKN